MYDCRHLLISSVWLIKVYWISLSLPEDGSMLLPTSKYNSLQLCDIRALNCSQYVGRSLVCFFPPRIILSSYSFFLTYFSQYLAHNLAIFPIIMYLLRLYKCWRSVGHQVLQPAKDVKLGQYVWKVADRRKNPWCTKTASNLQPSDLCSNANRSLPGNQDISPCFFHVFILSFLVYHAWLLYHDVLTALLEYLNLSAAFSWAYFELILFKTFLLKCFHLFNVKQAKLQFSDNDFSKISLIFPEFRSLLLASYFSKNFAGKIGTVLSVCFKRLLNTFRTAVFAE